MALRVIHRQKMLHRVPEFVDSISIVPERWFPRVDSMCTPIGVISIVL